MAKEGEIAITRMKGESAIQFGLQKPFSSMDCPSMLMRIGAVMALMPPPPARLLDLGCGMGWTSIFFAQRGYDVVGVDIAPDKIEYANLRKARAQAPNVHFAIYDYESLPFQDEFDIVVFHDSLHHAMDEALALRMAYRALKSGGICVTSEPGVGHGQQPGALRAVQLYNVTEKDMPPAHVRRLGMQAGFRQCRVHLEPWQLWQSATPYNGRRWPLLCARWRWAYYLRSIWRLVRQLRGMEAQAGFVVLTK